jgi:hypothetical protein
VFCKIIFSNKFGFILETVFGDMTGDMTVHPTAILSNTTKYNQIGVRIEKQHLCCNILSACHLVKHNYFHPIQPGVNLIKFFCVNLLTLFCKLDHFITIHNIYDIAMKRYSIQNRVRKFTPKKFYEIDPRG